MPKKVLTFSGSDKIYAFLDNPGLHESVKSGATLPVFIFDDENSKIY